MMDRAIITTVSPVNANRILTRPNRVYTMIVGYYCITHIDHKCAGASDPHHNPSKCKLCQQLPNWKNFCDPIESETVWQTSYDNDTNYMPDYYLDGW